MDEEKDFQFKHISKEDFNRTYKKINRDRQKQMDAQQWNNYMESIKDVDSKKTYSVQNNSEVKQNEQLLNKCTNSQFSTCDSANLYSLHDPYDLNHIHGLRNRLFKTFNEFANILENALLPPVLKTTKKMQIKIKDCDQQTNTNYISDLNALISDIKKESKNENLHVKKNKSNITLRKMFQMKLIQCYKLSINTIKICSKTLEAGIYNPVQIKMKNLIQIVSTLSFIAGKYIYGELFKKKKKESFDLVQRCKVLESMLDECGYKDMESNNHNNIHDNTLNKLANKALTKNRSQLVSDNSNRLNMYNQTKPKLGTYYAQTWSKNKDMDDKHSYNSKMINEKPVLFKQDKIKNSKNTLTNDNLDNIKTLIEKYPFEQLNLNETNKLFCSDIENERLIYSNEIKNLQTSSKLLKLDKLKTTNNVKLYIVKENIWRKFPIKNISLSQNGSLLLNISPEIVQSLYLYKRQFKSLSISEHQLDNISNVTESIINELMIEVLSKINCACDAFIEELVKTELEFFN